MSWEIIKRNKNYSINEYGQVRNNETFKILSPYLNKSNGYYTVDLYKDNKRCKVTIHRLIAETFIPNIENKPCVDHINGDRTNNSINNLRWATYSENNSRFGTIGVRSEKIKVTKYEEKRNKRGGGHLEWLGEQEVLFFDRITDCANFFGTTTGNISLMLKKGAIGVRGKTRTYKFEYLK